MVKLPRSHFEESKLYTGTAPLFASMADPFSYPPHEARRTGRNVARENKQFESRFAIVRFRKEIPVPERDVTLKPCPSCAAVWYGELVQQVLAEGPPVQISMHASAPQNSPPRPLAPVHQQGFFEQLNALMRWKSEGLLSDAEFLRAKQQLGLSQESPN